MNRALEAMGMTRVMWLTSGALRLPVVLMFLWKNLGFCLIIFLAALQSIPQPLYEYAQLEGAGFFTRFPHYAADDYADGVSGVRAGVDQCV